MNRILCWWLIDGVGEVNPLGVDYYNNVINALVEASESHSLSPFIQIFILTSCHDIMCPQ